MYNILIEFETSAEVSIQGIWKKAYNLWAKGVFSPLFSRNFDDQLSPNFHKFVI